MSKKIVTVFSLLLTSVMIFASVLFIDAYLTETDDIHLLLILIIFLLLTLAMILAVIFENFVGHKEIIFEKETIIICRKGKQLYTISQADIEKAVFTYDAYNKELCSLCFISGGKKHYVSVNKANKRAIETFFSKIKYLKRDNTLGYFIQHLLEVFS